MSLIHAQSDSAKDDDQFIASSSVLSPSNTYGNGPSHQITIAQGYNNSN